MAKKDGLDIIVLPKLNSSALFSVSGRVLAQAKRLQDEKKQDKKAAGLPAVFSKRLNLLRESRKRLSEVLARRPQKKTTTDDPGAVEADNREDRAVSALLTFLEAHAKRPDDKGKSAARVIANVFGDGTKFLNLRYEEQFGEVDARIERIKAEGYDTAIHELGGEAFLADLVEAHRNYGEALGITSGRALREAAPDVAGARADTAAHLRRLVAAIVGFASDSDFEPERTYVADSLLMPIEEIRLRNAKRARTGEESVDEPTDEDEDEVDETVFDDADGEDVTERQEGAAKKPKPR